MACHPYANGRFLSTARDLRLGTFILGRRETDELLKEVFALASSTRCSDLARLEGSPRDTR